MESWLIPAEPVTFVEEIKKIRFITLLAHTDVGGRTAGRFATVGVF